MIESIRIKNVETEEDFYMDKLTTQDYILDYVDWGSAEADQFTSKYVGQVGVSVNQTSFKQRDIEISGFIVADTEEQMSERKKFLNRFINPQKEYEAIYKDYKIGFRPIASIRYTNTEESNNNEVICKFKISGFCPNPLFALTDIVKMELKGEQGMFHFPFHTTDTVGAVFGIELNSETKERVIINRGAVDIGIKFTFVNNGTQEEIISPTLYNYTTNQHFTVARGLYPSQFITVDTNIGSKSIIGGFNWATNTVNYFKYKTIDSEWIVLKPGENLIGFSAEFNEDLLSVKVEIDNRFLEVQECY